MPRHFTPDEANAELNEIRPLVEELVSHRREQQALQAKRVDLAAKIAGNGGGIAIHERGAIVKDLGTGLIDFPARLHGEEVLLCWRLGEDRVEHWHGLEEGFAGRKQLDPE